jgi:hypothetical protein
VTPPTLHRIFASLPHGLDDYTSDQRGDVGSFIRIASIRGSVALVSSILASPRPEEWMTREEFRAVLGKLVKLGAERIDGVRKVAGEGLKLLVIGEEGREGVGGEKKKTAGGAAEKEDMWEIPGRETMRAFFEEYVSLPPLELTSKQQIGDLSDLSLCPSPDAIRWNEASSVFPRIVALISQPILRRSILEGLSLSIGSRSEGTTRTASKSFLTYLSTLPATSLSPSEASLLSITRTLVDIAGQNPTLNRVFIPVLDTLVLLFEDGDLVRLAGSRSGSGKATVRAVFAMACKDIGRIRNVQRVTSCMKMLVSSLGSRFPLLDILPYHMPTPADPNSSLTKQHHRHGRYLLLLPRRHQDPAFPTRPSIPDRTSSPRLPLLRSTPVILDGSLLINVSIHAPGPVRYGRTTLPRPSNGRLPRIGGDRRAPSRDELVF